MLKFAGGYVKKINFSARTLYATLHSILNEIFGCKIMIKLSMIMYSLSFSF